MPFRPKKASPQFADLKGILAQSKQPDNALYQTVQEIIERLTSFKEFTLEEIQKGGSGNGGNATKTATYITQIDETSGLPNSRRLVEGVNISFNTGTPGQFIINATPSGGGGGDVFGPASAVSGNIAIYSGTTGKVISDGGTSLVSINTSLTTLTNQNNLQDSQINTINTNAAFKNQSNIFTLPQTFQSSVHVDENFDCDGDIIGLADLNVNGIGFFAGGLNGTPLDATQLFGLVPIASLPPNIAYKDQANVFIQPQKIETAAPRLTLNDLNQAVDSRNFRMTNAGGAILFRAMNDLENVVQADVLKLERDGDVFVLKDLTAGGFLSVGAVPATIGTIRLPNNTGIYARNAANTLNIPLIKIDGSNQIFVGDSNVPTLTLQAGLYGLGMNNSGLMYPLAGDNIQPFGYPSIRWANVYSVLGDFSGGLGSTPLNATQLTTGTVADARLSVNVLKHTGGYPGGTTNFLRADGTFAAPSGGGGGSGDVIGPASSTDNAIVRFDGTTGKLIQNSLASIDDGGRLLVSNGITVSGAATIDPNVSIFYGTTASEVRLASLSEPTNYKYIRLLNYQQQFQVWMADDALGQQAYLKIDRTGHTYITGNYYELGRSVAQGNWISVPYNASHYVTDGGRTWNVSSGNILVNKYTLIGSTCIWTVRIVGSTVSGPAGQPANMWINLPVNSAIAGDGFTRGYINWGSGNLQDYGVYTYDATRVVLQALPGTVGFVLTSPNIMPIWFTIIYQIA